MVELGFAQLLLSSTALQAVVADRIYASLTPEDATAKTLPCVVFQDISLVSDDLTLDNRLSSAGEMRMQVTYMAESYEGSKLLQAIGDGFLNGWQGTMSEGTVVDSILRVNKYSGYEPSTRTHHAFSDYKILFQGN